ncbi:TRL domain-containing protein [Leptospira sp. WS60.C2]
MKLIKIFTFVFFLSIFTNCQSGPFPAFLYQYSTQHTTGDSTGNNLTSAKIVKFGKSCSMSGYIINVFFYGAGNSIEEAARNGKIQKVAVVDRESLSILGFLFYRECIIAWGE